MGLDWSTFLLEVANFLILIWILKRFLYAPVKAAIESRRQQVEAVLEQARETRADAEQLRAEYRGRMQNWEQVQARVKADLEQELAAERNRKTALIEQELAHRREQAETLEIKRRRDAAREAEETALAQAAAFATRLLTRTADRGLERRLVEMALEDMPDLTAEQRGALAACAGPDAPGVLVQTAFPLGQEQRRAVENTLARAAGSRLRCEFRQDPELIAGLRIDAGALAMSWNLRDELALFREAGR